MTKIVNILEHKLEQIVTNDEFIELYTMMYNICIECGGQDNTQHIHHQLIYNPYKEFLSEYINSIVLLVLQEKLWEFLLEELVTKWKNYKDLV